MTVLRSIYSLPFKGSVFRLFTVKWPNWYVYMQSNAQGNVRGWDGLPGYQGELILTPLSPNSELFLISTKTWPNWYLYMQDNAEGNVRGWLREIQGHKDTGLSVSDTMVRVLAFHCQVGEVAYVHAR